jgi:hypothetical protein
VSRGVAIATAAPRTTAAASTVGASDSHQDVRTPVRTSATRLANPVQTSSATRTQVREEIPPQPASAPESIATFPTKLERGGRPATRSVHARSARPRKAVDAGNGTPTSGSSSSSRLTSLSSSEAVRYGAGSSTVTPAFC